MAVVNPENGYIDALVGGRDYESSQVNMATGEGGAGRQAGSSFKLFTLLAAINEGIDPETLIDAGYKVDLEGGEPVYNNDKADYGTRTIKSAFGVSSNTAFIRLLLSVGVDKVIEMAHAMGITSDLPAVAGLTLGIGSVTPLEMADAYATVANGGVHYDPECIISIEDKNGNVIVDNTDPTASGCSLAKWPGQRSTAWKWSSTTAPARRLAPITARRPAARPVPPTTRRTAGFAV